MKECVMPSGWKFLIGSFLILHSSFFILHSSFLILNSSFLILLMILANLSDAWRYEGMHPLFSRVFEYVRATDFSAVPTGRIELDGDRLFINVCETELVPAEIQKLEVHRSYIDIHVPLLQTETIGWKHLSDLGASEAPFDEEGDFALYADTQVVHIPVQPGQFLAVWPEDAHAPLIGQGHQRKLIVKVLL